MHIYLNSHGPIDTEKKNQRGLTALLYIVEKNRHSLTGRIFSQLKLLHSLGADFQAQDDHGRTALHIAAEGVMTRSDDKIQKRYDSIVNLLTTLIRYGTPVYILDNEGRTALSIYVEPPCLFRGDLTLRPRVWIEALQKSGHDPVNFQVLSEAFPDLRRKSADQTGQSQTNHEGNGHLGDDDLGSSPEPDESDSPSDYSADAWEEDGDNCSDDNSPDLSPGSGFSDSLSDCHDDYSAGGCGELDDSPESLEQVWTSGAISSSAPSSASSEPQPRTFWAVIDHAVEQEGNPWV